MQPGTQYIQRLLRAAREYLNVAVVEVKRVTGDAELLGFAARTVPEPDTLYTPTYPDKPGLTSRTARSRRYTPSSSVESVEDSMALRASRAFIFACVASRLACEYCRSLSRFSAFFR